MAAIAGLEAWGDGDMGREDDGGWVLGSKRTRKKQGVSRQVGLKVSFVTDDQGLKSRADWQGGHLMFWLTQELGSGFIGGERG